MKTPGKKKVRAAIPTHNPRTTCIPSGSASPHSDDAVAGIGALEHMLRVGAMFVIPADRFDTSTYSKVNDEPTAYYYEKLFRRYRRRQETIRSVANCLGERY